MFPSDRAESRCVTGKKVVIGYRGDYAVQVLPCHSIVIIRINDETSNMPMILFQLVFLSI
jgi:hypothetical protein